MTDPVKVSPADRELAAEIYRRFRYGANDCVNHAICTGIIAGERDDDPIVYLVSRHRTSPLTQLEQAA